MNNTNRALNRIGIFLVGLVLFALGASAAAAAAIPDWLDAWKSGSATVSDTSCKASTLPKLLLTRSSRITAASGDSRASASRGWCRTCRCRRPSRCSMWWRKDSAILQRS